MTKANLLKFVTIYTNSSNTKQLSKAERALKIYYGVDKTGTPMVIGTIGGGGV